MAMSIKKILKVFTLNKARAFDRTDPSHVNIAQMLHYYLVEAQNSSVFGGVVGEDLPSILESVSAAGALPAHVEGARYRCTVSGKGWTADAIYTSLSGEWDEFVPNEGVIVTDEAEDVILFYTGSAWVDISGMISAASVIYDHTGSTTPLSAVTVEAAIDELDANVAAHISDATAAHAATAVSYDPTASGLGVNTAQAALDAVDAIADGAVTDAATADGKAVAAQGDADDALVFTRINPLPDNESSGGGAVIEWTNNTGVAVAITKLVAISGSGEISLANAAVGSLVGPAMGITTEAIADGATGKVLMWGIYRDDAAFAGFTAGDKLYLDEVAGGIVNEANVPDTAGDVQQRVGICTNSSDGNYIIYFWPALLEVVVV